MKGHPLRFAGTRASSAFLCPADELLRLTWMPQRTTMMGRAGPDFRERAVYPLQQWSRKNVVWLATLLLVLPVRPAPACCCPEGCPECVTASPGVASCCQWASGVGDALQRSGSCPCCHPSQARTGPDRSGSCSCDCQCGGHQPAPAESSRQSLADGTSSFFVSFLADADTEAVFTRFLPAVLSRGLCGTDRCILLCRFIL